MMMWAMSDRTIPRSLRMIEGFGVHTFRFVNAEGRGQVRQVPLEARARACSRPAGTRRSRSPAPTRTSTAATCSRRSTRGDFPEWDLGVQVFDEAFAAEQPYDVLDATKLIPEEVLPVEIIGRMTLNRNVDNFFAETEQVAFLPSNVIPGIDFTQRPAAAGPAVLVPRHAEVAPRHDQLPPDPDQRAQVPVSQLPARRHDADADTHRARQLRAEQPRRGRRGRRPARSHATPASPASPGNDERNDPTEKLRVRAGPVRRSLQPAAPVLPLADRDRAGAHRLGVRLRAVEGGARRTCASACCRGCAIVDEKLAKRVADGLAMALPPKATGGRDPVKMELSPALSIVRNAKATLVGRKVGILFAEGSDAPRSRRSRRRSTAAGATVDADRAQGRRHPGQGRHARGRWPAGGHALGRCSMPSRWC